MAHSALIPNSLISGHVFAVTPKFCYPGDAFTGVTGRRQREAVAPRASRLSARPCGNVPVSVRSIRVEFAPRALIARLSG